MVPTNNTKPQTLPPLVQSTLVTSAGEQLTNMSDMHGRQEIKGAVSRSLKCYSV